MLNEKERRQLLLIARESIERHLAGEPPLSVLPPLMPGASGVFVTLRNRGQLRGCLGVLEMRDSLPAEVARCARDAATQDPRFPPISSDELSETSVEISALGPLEKIDPRIDGAIVIGRHGLVVEQGTRRGLLLPQVALEWGWLAQQFLRQTCHKAGLPLDAWSRGARVYRFEAEVFGE